MSPSGASVKAIDVNSLKTADEARTLMANAKRLGRDDIVQAAFRRVCQLEGRAHDDPVVVQFWCALAAVEEVLRLKHGKALKAAYTRRKVAAVGEVACLTGWALKKHETEGFKMSSRLASAIRPGNMLLCKTPTAFRLTL